MRETPNSRCVAVSLPSDASAAWNQSWNECSSHSCPAKVTKGTLLLAPPTGGDVGTFAGLDRMGRHHKDA